MKYRVIVSNIASADIADAVAAHLDSEQAKLAGIVVTVEPDFANSPDAAIDDDDEAEVGA